MVRKCKCRFFEYSKMKTQDTFSVLENHVRMTELLHAPVTSKEGLKYLLRDSIISICYTYVQNGCPIKIQNQFKPFHSCKNEL